MQNFIASLEKKLGEKIEHLVPSVRKGPSSGPSLHEPIHAPLWLLAYWRSFSPFCCLIYYSLPYWESLTTLYPTLSYLQIHSICFIAGNQHPVCFYFPSTYLRDPSWASIAYGRIFKYITLDLTCVLLFFFPPLFPSFSPPLPSSLPTLCIFCFVFLLF